MIYNRATVAQDFKAGFFVFLLALPLCLGISIASSSPPIAGVFTAVVGGLICSFLGSARLTIKGPAAGLIVIVAGAVAELGAGDILVGYRQMLAVGVIAAVIQIVFGLTRAGIIGELVPSSVVHGMLSAIGVIIIAKQSHSLIGVTPTSKNPIALIGELPTHFTDINPMVLVVAVLTLGFLIFWPRFSPKVSKSVPAAILALGCSIIISILFNFENEHDYELLSHSYHIGPGFLINLPEKFFSAMTFPDFSAISSWVSIKYIIMLSLVGSIESLLTVKAVDTMSTDKTVADLNKDLLATGVGNLIAAFIGGLPMISEIVRSKANVDNGAKTVQSNFFHGLLLLISVAVFPGILHLIPAATLAAMLVFTGFRLASPKEFQHTYRIGLDQFAPFLTTLIVTLSTDLLVGVIAGIVVQFLINMHHGFRLKDAFSVNHTIKEDVGTIELQVLSPIGFLNSHRLKKILEKKIAANSKIIIDLSKCDFVEHSCFKVIESLTKNQDQVTISIKGLDAHDQKSRHEQASRVLRKA